MTSTTDLSEPGVHAGELNLPLVPVAGPDDGDDGDGDDPGSPDGALPDTGPQVGAPYLLAALAALAVGGALAIGGRRRREHGEEL